LLTSRRFLVFDIQTARTRKNRETFGYGSPIPRSGVLISCARGRQTGSMFSGSAIILKRVIRAPTAFRAAVPASVMSTRAEGLRAPGLPVSAHQGRYAFDRTIVQKLPQFLETYGLASDSNADTIKDVRDVDSRTA